MTTALSQIPLAPVPRIALRRAEAAEALGVSDRTLWDWTKQGLVPNVRINQTIMYPVADLAAWLSEQSTQQLLENENTRADAGEK